MKLSEDERELLTAELAQALEQVRSPELKSAYTALLAAADEGEVPDDLLEPLQSLLEVGLESGRIRRVHTAHGEMAANRLYARTPRGQAARSAAEQVNLALRALAGQTLEDVTVTAAGPGSYSLSLTTDQGRLLLRFSRHGVSLQSVEVG
ncbi:MAG TPA: hypothetical protein VFU47_08390 [Armatimonadota bacterium]|nr:hypothetical protein [Armatimonadota bacterium]